MDSGQPNAATAVSRQAVVVVHGIGEQRPMDTLRRFARGAIGRADNRDRFFSKPDRISDTLELRRLAAFPPDVPIQTDFYELYWAHLMDGTAWQHVIAWFQMLLLRKPPRRLVAAWIAAWVLLVVGGGLYLTWLLNDQSAALTTGAVSVVLLTIARWTIGPIGLKVVGDAARYLSPSPTNIKVRHAIRSAALALLRGLHADTRYDRIIVVGHSLGSVIAYDALTYLWQEVHSHHGSPAVADQRAYEKMRGYCQSSTHPTSSDFRATQRALWGEQRDLGIPWRVTDLVTLGSPLTYAPFLIAGNSADFTERQRQRELPTCPPQPDDERDIGFLSKEYETPLGPQTLRILHHAALFACTRWTNVFFPADLVGGKLAPLFGGGIQDLEITPSTFLGRLPTAHTRYWHAKERHAMTMLYDALDLADASATGGATRVAVEFEHVS